MEIECGFKVPGERYPGVISYDSVKEGENSFGIRTNPTNLKFGNFGSLFSFWIKYFIGNVKIEWGFKVSGKGYPGVISYDGVKEGENGFRIGTNPNNSKFGNFGSLLSIKRYPGAI